MQTIVQSLLPLTASTDMVIDNDPPITRNVSVPRDMSQLSCSSFTAGVVEAVLDGLGFVRSAQCIVDLNAHLEI